MTHHATTVLLLVTFLLAIHEEGRAGGFSSDRYSYSSAGGWGHKALAEPVWGHPPRIHKNRRIPKVKEGTPRKLIRGAARVVQASHYELEYVLGRKIIFLCTARGNPRPRITWYKDGVELYAHNYFQPSAALTHASLPAGARVGDWAAQVEEQDGDRPRHSDGRGLLRVSGQQHTCSGSPGLQDPVHGRPLVRLPVQPLHPSAPRCGTPVHLYSPWCGSKYTLDRLSTLIASWCGSQYTISLPVRLPVTFKLLTV